MSTSRRRQSAYADVEERVSCRRVQKGAAVSWPASFALMAGLLAGVREPIARGRLVHDRRASIAALAATRALGAREWREHMLQRDGAPTAQ
jgi:hypothetical protein